MIICEIYLAMILFFFQAEDGIRDYKVTGVQTCALPIALATTPGGSLPPTSSVHRLRRGLPGYLILFAPHAVAPQCQQRPSRTPSPLVFFPISTHSTATPGIPSAPTVLYPASLAGSPGVEQRDFTSDLTGHLRALYAQ